MNCTRCKQPIAPERLVAVPDTTMCVPCLRASGDVKLKKGRMAYDHKTGGALEVVSEEQLNRMKEAQDSVEERVSRL